MKFKDENYWKVGLENNQDPYGMGIYTFAERWADGMEARIDEGFALKDVADVESHKADTEGITGFMYGAAVSILSACWVHGEDLRRWHNLGTQIGNEGEKANESGGVLNPALMNISTGD